MSDVSPVTSRLLEFIDASPTPYHAVQEMTRTLVAHGFAVISEVDAWKLAPGGRYLVTRNGSSLVAFVVGTGVAAESGFRFVGGHSDSPNLRLKPRPEIISQGFRQLGVEVYGGVLLSTWLDRDLSLAGRVYVADRPEPLLLKVDRPLCRIPNLAIHLDRGVNEDGVKLNSQNHMPPILAMLGDPEDPTWARTIIGNELSVDPGAILGYDLMLFDTQKSTVSGLEGEFIHAPRLDNLGSCHAAMEALLASLERGTPRSTVGFVVYDHEEVGSETAQGAASTFLESVLERVVLITGGNREDLRRATARSLFVSADMAHAIHPNRADRHEPFHQPRLNMGPVIKVNSNQRYATDGSTAASFLQLAREAGVTTQYFVTRTDLPCGSTIGPITASRLGMPTVDVGNPMLSMHSAREMAGSRDPEQMVKIMARLFA